MVKLHRAVGLALGLSSALIGAGWQVATRVATTSTLPPQELVILRFGIPALILSPIAVLTLIRGCELNLWRLAMMVAGAGLPFALIAMKGASLAPSAHMGVLMAGASPLMSAALAWMIWKERPGHERALGLGLMALGVVALASQSVSSWSQATLLGDGCFLLAAALWAGFTVSFRGSGLSPWQGAALINACSGLMVLFWVVARGGSDLLLVPPGDLAWQAAWQGILAGLLGLWAYAGAIARLGAQAAAAFGALVPVLSATGGAIWLGDRLSVLDEVAIAACVLGVGLASGVHRQLLRPRIAS